MSDNKERPLNFGDGFRAWKKKTGFAGTTAITRYVMFLFLEELNNRRPDEYIVKGGNLLWHYINTPRPTTDLDLTTLTMSEVDQILEDMKDLSASGVAFKVVKHEVKTSNRHVGLMLKVGYETDTGQHDIFGIDCVLRTPTHVAEVVFLRNESKAASIENIVMDKLNACHDFGHDNTRMKDFDDLYRIATDSGLRLRANILRDLSEVRRIPLKIDAKTSESLSKHWERYLDRKGYPGASVLPRDISEVIDIVNKFLSRF